jgi:hypothetical protein
LQKTDPENRLFGRANRRRLEAEAIRDSILFVSGQLTAPRGGQTYPADLSADYGYKANDNRRSVYLPVFRNSLPELFEVFDFADPSMVTGKRTTSTVAPQALFMLNNPFPIEQAKHAAARLLAEGPSNDNARIAYVYRLALGREPTNREREIAARFVQRSPNASEGWAALCQALFASADFRYVN